MNQGIIYLDAFYKIVLNFGNLSIFITFLFLYSLPSCSILSYENVTQYIWNSFDINTIFFSMCVMIKSGETYWLLYLVSKKNF